MKQQKINSYIVDGIQAYSQDKYWGKVSEDELKDVIDNIDKSGFGYFNKDLQKKFDFTFHEDRADWRFYLPLSNKSRVLDIGAGLGRITIPLARVCGEVVACDQSITRMRFLKRRASAERLSNINIIVSDIFDLPFEEDSFDLIVMNGVLEWVGLTDLYISPKEAQIKSLEICKRLLKKGGSLYVGIENRYALAYLRARDHGGLRYTNYMPRFLANIYSKLMGYGPYKTYTYSKKGYEKLFTQAGFVDSKDFYLVYPGYNLPRILVPYNSIQALQYLVKTFKKPNNFFNKFICKMASLSIFVRLYRLSFYSFAIFLKK